MIRIDFPGFRGEQTLEPVSWEEWFKKFEEKEPALVVENQPPIFHLIPFLQVHLFDKELLLPNLSYLKTPEN
jgi:hypothetical protein